MDVFLIAKKFFARFYLDFPLQLIIKVKRRAVINRTNCSSREVKIEMRDQAGNYRLI